MFNKKTPAVKKAALKRNGGGEANSGFQGANCRGKGKGKTAVRTHGPCNRCTMELMPYAHIGTINRDAFDDDARCRIMAPYLRDQWPSHTVTMKLKMCASPGDSHFWVWFHFEVVSGIMRSVRREGGGRGGEMTYEDENIGSITFLGAGRIREKMR